MATPGEDQAESSEAVRLLSEVKSLISEKMKEAGISPSDCSNPQQDEFKAAELKEARAKKNQKTPIDKTKFNCAVTGRIGVGKSSLVNALLAILNRDAGAAKLDCTQDVVPYSCDLSNVVLWDMPGAGSTSYPTESYYEDTRLGEFDRILILLGDRVFEIDIQIAKKAIEDKRETIFVISKADSRIKDLATKNGTNMSEASKTFDAIVREGFKEELKSRGVVVEGQIIVVSSNGFLPISPYINYYTGERGRPDKSLKRRDERDLLNILFKNSKNTIDLNSLWSDAIKSDANEDENKIGNTLGVRWGLVREKALELGKHGWNFGEQGWKQVKTLKTRLVPGTRTGTGTAPQKPELEPKLEPKPEESEHFGKGTSTEH